VYGLVEAVKTNASTVCDTKKATPGEVARSLGRKRPWEGLRDRNVIAARIIDLSASRAANNRL
jgi:hypothetical protein